MRIGYHRSHEASVAVFDEDGQPLFAVAEERYSRKKMQGGWPKLVMQDVRRRYDVEEGQAYFGGLPMSQRLRREAGLSLFNARNGKLQDFHAKRVSKLLGQLSGSSTKSEGDMLDGIPRTFVDHHTCHAASAYYQSGFDDAVVVTVDGVGDAYSARVFRGKKGRLIPVRAYYHTEFPVGHNYQFITAALGMNPHRHAGKVTGLAAHGTYDERLEQTLETWMDEIWSSSKGRPYFFMLHTRDGSNNEDPDYEEAVAELRQTRKERFGDWSNADIAYAIQSYLEREVLQMIQDNVPEIDGQPICLAGGVFANVKLNKHVKELGFGQLFVQPAMSDAGLAVGGPLYEMARAGDLTPYRLSNVYLGPEFADGEIESAIRDANLDFKRFDSVEPEIARLLADGRVVARFNGRMEFGPRALGNRSVLYHASDPAVNDWLNERLDRTEFMPFAPATIDDEAKRHRWSRPSPRTRRMRSSV